MEFPNRLIERIYEEKDSATNFSILLASIGALIAYKITDDYFISAVFVLSIFAFSKIVFGIVKDYFAIRTNDKLKFEEFSLNEKKAIEVFTDLGVCFITYSDFKNGVFGESTAGLVSLERRGIVHFVEDGTAPTGFILNEDIYKKFLKVAK